MRVVAGVAVIPVLVEGTRMEGTMTEDAETDMAARPVESSAHHTNAWGENGIQDYLDNE